MVDVYEFEELGYGHVYQCPMLTSFIALHQRLSTFVFSYVASRNIVTLFECERDFLFMEGVSEFMNLGLGNSFHHHPVVMQCFPSFLHRPIPQITTVQVIRYLKEYMTNRQEQHGVDVDLFMHHLASNNCFQVSTPDELGIQMNSPALVIKMVGMIVNREKKELLKLKQDFQKEIDLKVFRAAKAQAPGLQQPQPQGLPNTDEVVRISPKLSEHAKRTQLSAKILGQITKMDGTLDRLLMIHSSILPRNASLSISRLDIQLRKQVESQMKLNPKSRIIVSVLSSMISKTVHLIEKNPVNETCDESEDDEEECSCCCVGEDQCVCECDCECHQDDTNVSKSNPRKETQTKVPEKERVAVTVEEMVAEIQEWWASKSSTRDEGVLDRLVQLEDHMCSKFNIVSQLCPTTPSLLQLIKSASNSSLENSLKDGFSSMNYHPQQHVISKESAAQLIHQCPDLEDHDSIESIICHHFQIPSINVLGYGEIETLISESEQIMKMLPLHQSSPRRIFSGAVLRCTMDTSPVSKSDIIARLRQAPFLIDIDGWMQWTTLNLQQHCDGLSLGEFIQEQGRTIQELIVVEVTKHRFIRIDPTSTVADILHAGLNHNPLECATHIFSVYTKMGGKSMFPLQLVQSHLRHIMKIVGSDPVFWKTLLIHLPHQTAILVIDLIVEEGSKGRDSFCELIQNLCSSPDQHSILYALGTSKKISAWMMLAPQHLSQKVICKPNVIEKCEDCVTPTAASLAFPTDADQSTTLVMERGHEIVQMIRTEEFGIGVDFGPVGKKVIQAQYQRLERAVARLSSELYARDCHFVLELIQNADDNRYSSDVIPEITFCLSSTELVYWNNELGFSEANIRAICDVGASTKTKHLDEDGKSSLLIGHKGIGFKSVFKVTDTPQVHSNGFHIQFNAKDQPLGYIVPHWIGTENQDDSTSGTSIIMPLNNHMRRNIKTSTNQLMQLKSSILLFLNKIQKLAIRNEIQSTQMTFSKTVRTTDHHQCTIVNLACNDELSQSWFVFEEKRTIPLSFASQRRSSSIKLAFPRLSTATSSPCDVFAYLPLRSYGFRFIVQAEFIVPSSREAIDCDHEWNQWLISEIPQVYVNALGQFKENQQTHNIGLWYSFIPLEHEIEYPFQRAARELCSQLRQVECIPMVIEMGKGHEGEETQTRWRKPSQVMICPKSLERELLQLLPDEVLHQYCGLYWCPEAAFVNYPKLPAALGVETFGLDHLLQLANDLRSSWIEKGMTWISQFFSIAIQLIQQSPIISRERYIRRLKQLPILPIGEQVPVAVSLLSREKVYFPAISEQSSILLCLEEESIAILNSTLYSLLQNTDVQEKNRIIYFMEHILGMKQLTLKEVVQSTIVPAFESADHTKLSLSKEKIIKYILILKIHWETLENAAVTEAYDWSRIRKCIPFILSSGKIVTFSMEEKIYLPSAFATSSDCTGNPMFLNTTFVDSISNKAFLAFLGIHEYLEIVLVDENDWQCPGFETLLSAISASALDSEDKEKSRPELTELLLRWIRYFDAVWKPEYASTLKTNTCSTICKRLRSQAWLVNENLTFMPPHALWLPKCQSIFGRSVSYVHADLMNALGNASFVSAIQLNIECTVTNVLQTLEGWSKSSAGRHKGMSKEVVVRCYEYLLHQCHGSSTTVMKIREKFQHTSLIWIPSSSSAHGMHQFTPLSSVIWKDKTALLMHREFVLAENYPKRLRSFFIEVLHISLCPTFQSICMDWQHSKIVMTPNHIWKCLEYVVTECKQNNEALDESEQRQIKNQLQELEWIPSRDGLTFLPLEPKDSGRRLLLPDPTWDDVLPRCIHVVDLAVLPECMSHVLRQLGLRTVCEHILQSRLCWTEMLERSTLDFPFEQAKALIESVFQMWYLENQDAATEVQTLVRNKRIFPTDKKTFVYAHELYQNDFPEAAAEISRLRCDVAFLSRDYPTSSLALIGALIPHLSQHLETQVAMTDTTDIENILRISHVCLREWVTTLRNYLALASTLLLDSADDHSKITHLLTELPQLQIHYRASLCRIYTLGRKGEYRNMKYRNMNMDMKI